MSLENKTFTELITFTRATGGGRFNAQGQYEWLAANQPRFDFDPVTLQPRGILIEEQRTNLLRRSEEFQTTWTNERSSEQVDVIISPAGTLTGCKLVEDTTSTNTHLILQGVSGLSSGSTLTFSVYIKAAERTSARLQINDGSSLENAVFAGYDVSAGAVSSVQNSGTFTGASATITPVGNGWYRCSISCVATGATAIQVRIFLISGITAIYTGDGTSGIYIWGAQLEAGAFPTSYIPTTTAQVTRAADVCSVNNLSPWYRADEGTLMVEALVGFPRTTPQVLVGIGDGTINNRLQLRVDNNNLAGLRIVSSASGTQVDAKATSQNLVGTTSKLASSFSGGFQRYSVNGVLHGISAPVSALPLVTVLQIGRGEGSSILQGYIRRVRYIPRRISDTELQALTAL